jgi:hypothetical protein
VGPGPARALRRARVRLLAAGAVAALALVPPPAAAAPPHEGLFVPGRSLGGVALGMSKAEVKRAWGTRFGRCRDCSSETWYFTYRRFEPQGAGVVFRRGRVTRVFTLWQPAGWRTAAGVRLGVDESAVTNAYGTLARRHCIRYSALVLRGRRAESAFYVFSGELWGFGLTRPGTSPCL